MAATLKARDTEQFASAKNYVDQVKIPVGANTKINQGVIVAVDQTTGLLAEALGTNANHIAVGVAFETVDNTGGAAGAKECLVRFGTFKFYISGAVPQSSVFKKIFVLDNQTVTLVAAANPRNSGILLRIAKTPVGKYDDLQAGEVWVKFDGSAILP